jgi:hypothetical protein
VVGVTRGVRAMGGKDVDVGGSVGKRLTVAVS